MKSFRDDNGTWHHTFRQSWLNTAELCPEQARLTHVNKLPDDNTDAAACGTAVHAGIEFYLGDTRSTYDECLELIEDTWFAEQREPGFRWVKYSGNTAWKWITTCWDHFWSRRGWYNRTTWETEWGFKVPLVDTPERVIQLSGTIDALAHDRIVDWKTSGRGEYEVREYQRWALQPTAYVYAVHHTSGNILPFHYNVLHADGLQRFEVHRDEQDFDWLREKCVAYAQLIEADLNVWPVHDNHWLCSRKWCTAWDLCKGKHYKEAT